MFSEDHKKLIDLSEKILSKEGQEDILDRLLSDRDEAARIYLYAAVDRLANEGEISTEEAAQHFQLLNLDRALVERLRQKHAMDS